MDAGKRRSIYSLSLFLAGFMAILIAIQFPAARQLVEKIGNAGPFGAFLSGILYAFAFTSSTATAIFALTPERFNILLIACVGGIGAALYDLAVFAFIRTEASHGFLQQIRERITLQRKFPQWLITAIGLAILASPLPDELASGLLSFSRISTKKFIIISALANTAGIFVILWLGRLR